MQKFVKWCILIQNLILKKGNLNIESLNKVKTSKIKSNKLHNLFILLLFTEMSLFWIS